jgi:Zn-dependent M16 (insulinase) family peptidase
MDRMTSIGGFRRISVTPLAALSARAHLFRHKKTGAELLWLDRASENKTFAIAFQTVPQDDTGVFHILEHSVLCGSEKYPVKEPFLELMKGSLNTFLNALTFSDKTMFPVSSRNDTDFSNLMHVYLDAVFCPNIYGNPNIFRQEGWHYGLDEDGKLGYMGMVLGEMKGAFSSVDEIIQTKLKRMLYPDTCYRFCSSGDPEHIPELIYEQFLESHRRFYHPSNARFFLDGTMNIEAVLADIDAEYLSRFNRQELDFSLAYQQAIPACTGIAEYEIAPGEDKVGKAHFVMGKVVGTWKDVEKLLALEVLQDYLSGSNSAPVTRAVLERGLGKDVQIALNDGIVQPYLALQVRNCTEEKLPEMKAAIQTIFREILNSGMDPKELTASLNRLEFRNRESREPYGVELAVRASQSWMYGGDPCVYLDLSGAFASLRGKLGSGYFAELLEETLLKEEGMAVLHVLPSGTLGEKKLESERARLAAVSAAWSDANKAAVAQAQNALSALQQSVDAPEALATIPHLALADLSAEPLWTVCAEEMRGDVHILRPQVTTAGTAYLNLYFALPEMDKEQLSELSLLPELLGSLPTRRRSVQLLQREIKTYLGGLEFSFAAIGQAGNPDQAVCYLQCNCSALESNVDHAVSLIREVLLETELSHPDRVQEILHQSYMKAQESLVIAGHQVAFYHAFAGLTAEGAAAEAIEGYGRYRYLKAAAENFDFAGTLERMEAVMGCLTGLTLTIGVTGRVSAEALDTLCSGFGGKAGEPTVTLEAVKSCKDSISIPAGIAHAVQGGNLYRLGGKNHGSYALAAKMLSLNYLWNEVRVQGGAYGAGMLIRNNGDVFSYSYQDPNPARTLEIYHGAAAYLRKFCENREAFDQLLIGAVSDSEPLLAASMESRRAVERALRGITLEQKRQEHRELLDASYTDLLRFCDMLEKGNEQKCTCIVGSAALLDACGDAAGNRLA